MNPISLTLASVRDVAGKPTALAAYAKDISALKLLEARLHRTTIVFMDAADPIIIRDLLGRIIDVNDVYSVQAARHNLYSSLA